MSEGQGQGQGPADPPAELSSRRRSSAFIGDPGAGRRGSLWKQGVATSARRASLWREEAEAGKNPGSKDEDGKSDTKSASFAASDTLLGTLKRLAEDNSTDYFQRLEDAVKKRKMMGNNNAGVLPIMSPESLFTKAIPLGMSLRTFCCSPSNRIGAYYSPETMELGDIYAASRCSRNKDVSSSAQQSIHFVSKRPPWKNPGKRPEKEVADYMLPAFTENELLFSLGRRNVDISRVFEGYHLDTLTSASKGSLDSIQLIESNENTFLADQQELVKHYQQLFLHISNMLMMKKQKADVAKLERKSDSVDKVDGQVPLKSKNRFYPQIVDSPRSLHTATSLQQLPTSSDIMKAADDIVRYHCYVETGVDESFITPINERWINRAIHLTGKYVKDGLLPDVIHSTLEHVKEEIQHDYVLSMRKAIVDYILQDETERHRLNLTEIDEVLHVITTGFIARSHTIQILTPEWRAAVLDAHGAVSGLLHKLNTQALELAALWQNLYSNKFFLDTTSNDFREHMPYELSSFVSREKLCASSVRESLDKDWIPTSASLLKQAVPIPPNSDLVGFYEAMQVLMGNQIRKLVEDSVINFANFFDVFKVEHFEKTSKSTTGEEVTDYPLPQKYKELFSSTAGHEMESIRLRNTPPFAVTLKYFNGVYSVDPSFEELQAELLEVLDYVVSQGSGILRVDAEKVKPSQRMLLAVADDDELVKVAKVHIRQVVHLNRNEPKGLIHYFEPFEDLANMDPESFATEFKLQEKPLQEYEDTLNKFQARAIEAETSSENDVDCGFVRVRCQEFKNILIEKAKHVSLLLKVQVLGQMTAANMGVIGRSEHISREITKMPTNPDEAVSLRNFDSHTRSFHMIGDLDKIDILADEVKILSSNLEEAQNTAELTNAEEILFGMPPTKYSQISQMVSTLDPYLKLWTIAANFKKFEEEWMSSPFFSLDTEKIESEVSTMFRTIYKLMKLFGEDFVEPAKAAGAIKASIDHFKENLPLFRCLCNPGLRPRHFEQVSEVVGFEIKSDDTISFRQLLRLQVDDHLPKLEEISEHASKEFSLERSLDQMEEDWKPLSFEVTEYKGTGTSILKGGPIEEAQILLEEHIVKTQNMLSSPFAQYFSEHISVWLKKVTVMQDILREWLKMQAAWMYLEPIFGSADILEQMPKEGSAFHAVDKVWRRIVVSVKETKCMLEVS